MAQAQKAVEKAPEQTTEKRGRMLSGKVVSNKMDKSITVLVERGVKHPVYGKYVTKSSGERKNVPWRADVVDQETGEVRRMDTIPTFRTWSASQSWGYTLKGLREIARL